MDKTIPDFFTSWLGSWLGRIKPDGTGSHWMASVKRIPTGYKGVFYVERKGEKILCIFYRKPGDRKQYEEKLGTSAQGWTTARAKLERTRRVNGQVMTNRERRQAQAKAQTGRRILAHYGEALGAIPGR